MANMKVASIVVEPELYPREETSEEHLRLYGAALEALPPVVVTDEGILVDGWHRLEAHRRAGRTEIEAETIRLPRAKVLETAIRLNSEHGYQLTLADKKRNAIALAKQGWKPKAISELLAVSRNRAQAWTREVRDEQRDEQNARIRQLWTACWTEEEIGEEVELTGQAVGQRLKEMAKSPDFSDPPDSLCDYTVWRFAKADPAYGVKYPGRMPGQVVENLLWRLTEPGDVVMDPFAGGCTTFDVCLAMGRRCLSTDIRPDPGRQKAGIVSRHDVSKGLPDVPLAVKQNGGPRLLLLDPPYGQQKRGEYGGERTNLANMSADRFNATLGDIFDSAAERLRAGAYMAIIVGATQKRGTYIDHNADCIVQLSGDARWERTVELVVPYQTEQYDGKDVAQARRNGEWLQLHRNLMLYRRTRGKAAAR